MYLEIGNHIHNLRDKLKRAWLSHKPEPSISDWDSISQASSVASRLSTQWVSEWLSDWINWINLIKRMFEILLWILFFNSIKRLHRRTARSKFLKCCGASPLRGVAAPLPRRHVAWSRGSRPRSFIAETISFISPALYKPRHRSSRHESTRAEQARLRWMANRVYHPPIF